MHYLFDVPSNKLVFQNGSLHKRCTLDVSFGDLHDPHIYTVTVMNKVTPNIAIVYANGVLEKLPKRNGPRDYFIIPPMILCILQIYKETNFFFFDNNNLLHLGKPALEVKHYKGYIFTNSEIIPFLDKVCDINKINEKFNRRQVRIDEYTEKYKLPTFVTRDPLKATVAAGFRTEIVDSLVNNVPNLEICLPYLQYCTRVDVYLNYYPSKVEFIEKAKKYNKRVSPKPKVETSKKLFMGIF